MKVTQCKLLVFFVVGAGSLAACSGGGRPAGAPDAGSPPIDPPDAVGPADAALDAAPDAPPDNAPGSVTGRGFYRCRQAAGDVEVPFYLPNTLVQAWIPDAASPGGFRVQRGVGRDDGSFAVPDVPEGVTYLLQIGDYYRYATDRRVIDYHIEQTKRCSPPPLLAEASTPVTYRVTGMTPYAAGPSPMPEDVIAVASSAIGYDRTLFSFVAPGATQLDITVDWGVAQPLPDAALGDDLLVSHRRSEVVTSAGSRTRVTRTVDQLQRTGPTLHSGAPATIDGAFSTVAADRTLTLAIDRSAVEAGYDPMIATIFFTAALVTDRGARIAEFQPISGAGPTQPQDIAYGDPFPASSPRSFVTTYALFRPFQYPGTFPFFFPVESRQVQPYPGPISPAPLVHPASGVLVGGVDFIAGGKLPSDGAPVHLQWSAAQGANSYALTVLRVTRAPGDTTFFAYVAQVRTADTALDLPASLFEDGAFYVFNLDAVRAANDYRAGEVEPAGLASNAALPSARFRMSSTCGDGAIQPGEDCDDSGESAACNSDCTAAVCGDGLRNAAAGEACDGTSELRGCDGDCTAVVCGDRHVNAAAGEECDEGPDNGTGSCSATCKRQ